MLDESPTSGPGRGGPPSYNNSIPHSTELTDRMKPISPLVSRCRKQEVYVNGRLIFPCPGPQGILDGSETFLPSTDLASHQQIDLPSILSNFLRGIYRWVINFFKSYKMFLSIQCRKQSLFSKQLHPVISLPCAKGENMHTCGSFTKCVLIKHAYF